jgi:hypothetical protein
MQFQALLGTQPLLAGAGINFVDLFERVQNEAHFRGKICSHLHKMSAAMRYASAQNRLECPRQIVIQAIAHLHRWRQALRAALQDLREVLPRMPHAGKKQRDPMPFPHRHDA